jgi:hypothetical protein
MEDLRQLCIHKKAARGSWWQYASAFNETCPLANFTRSCSESAMELSNIHAKDIRKCVDNSFAGKDIAKSDNKYLAKERQQLLDSGINIFPTLIINN